MDKEEAALADGAVQAVVVLAAPSERVVEPDARRWLARGRLDRSGRREEPLPRLLRVLDLPPLDGGLAALRYWEQTGTAPSDWIAAADPVWLEAGMNRLRLHPLPASELPVEDVSATFARLQTELGAAGASFEHVGAMGYLRGAPIATAELSPALAQGDAPERWLPPRTTAREHDRLLSEVQMCLHESEVNRRRLADGTAPLNALWLWGGGRAPPAAERPLPLLFADDPVVRGFWRSSSAPAEPWPGSIGGCLAARRGGFVAVAPAEEPASVLAELRGAMAQGMLRRLILLFADGLSADLRRGDRFRFWRRAT